MMDLKAGKNIYHRLAGAKAPAGIFYRQKQRGIMLLMLLVVVAIVSIMALSILPFFGTVKQRALEEDIENILEQSRRAIFMHTLQQAEKANKSYEGVILLETTGEIAMLGTESGEKELAKKIKQRMQSVVKSGLLRKSGVMRNLNNNNDAAVLSAYDAVEISFVHNLLEDSNFESIEASGATGANAIWRTGAAEGAYYTAAGAAAAGVTGEFLADKAEAFVLGSTSETPNSYKNRDFRMYNREKSTAIDDKGIVKGKFGKSSICIWNPPTDEVEK